MASSGGDGVYPKTQGLSLLSLMLYVLHIIMITVCSFVGNLFVEQDESIKSRVQSKNWFQALHSTHFFHCENSSLETLPFDPH